MLLTTKKLEKHTTRRERERNTKRGPTSKVEITPKKLKREKTPTQIQVPSLGPKPYIRCVSKSDKERGKNPKRAPTLEEAWPVMIARFLSNSPLLSRKWTPKLFTLFIHKVPRGVFLCSHFIHSPCGMGYVERRPGSTIDQQASPAAEREMEFHPSWDTFPPK